MSLFSDTEKTALLSDCGKYRWMLGRRWGGGRSVGWIMLNPSVADANVDDPTIRRCMGFSKAWGYSGMVVVNLFALRSTDPQILSQSPDPIGHECNDKIKAMALECDKVIAAWGSMEFAKKRASEIGEFILWRKPECLGTTKNGSPRHPLYVRGDTRLIPWVCK